KVVWTREEDIQHDMYRPYWYDRLSAGLDAKGMPVAWNNRFAGSSVIARWLPPGFKDGLDPDTTEGAIDLVYDLPNLHVEYVRAQGRALAQCVRDRELHGRAGGGGQTGSGRVPARASRQEPPRQGRARARRREGGVGADAAAPVGPRRLAPARLRDLHGTRRR